MTQIRRFGILQTAKVLGILYALAGLLLAPFFILATLLSPEQSPFGMAFGLLIPAFYGILGFVMTVIGAAIYNGVAGWVGGIEVELENTGGATSNAG